MPKTVTYNKLKSLIGEPLEAGRWFAVDQSRIDLFAKATDDNQYIHIDVERAKQTDLGGTIAHGFLSLSLLPKLSEDVMPALEHTEMGINYGFEKVRFLNMVRPGDLVRLSASVADVREKNTNQILISLNCTVEIKGQYKPAIVCEWINLFICSP